MLILETIDSLSSHLDDIRQKGLKIGFVPTMGALHKGHASLLAASLKDGNYTICNIFINPTQFNDKNDLANYPKTLDSDVKLLNEIGCDVLFCPSESEIYPDSSQPFSINLGAIADILEGKHRPGHFIGVAQVVSRLFEIVRPNYAYFGKKDYQQLQVIKRLVKIKSFPVSIIECETVREPDGLAMSSRNVRLTKEEREMATLIPKALKKAAEMRIHGLNVLEIKERIHILFNINDLYKLEYFEICHQNSLEPVFSFNSGTNYIALIACFVGKTRLIDNIVI